MKLAISLATRGRPERLADTLKRSICHWTDKNTVLWVMADVDDPQTVGPVSVLQAQGFPIKLDFQPRPDALAEKWNRIVALEPAADVYLIAADDAPDITPGYDTKILEAAKRFPDGIGVVYGHLANMSFPTVMAPTKKFVEKMGFLFPPYFPFWFVDHWVDDVARLIDRISFADVMTDQSAPGQTQEMREPGWWATWFDANYLVRRRQAQSIIESPDFQEFHWRREMLLSHSPLIEHRSRIVNNGVRQQYQHHELTSGLSLQDERYQRLRQRAVGMVPYMLDGMPADPEITRMGAIPINHPFFFGSWGARAYLEALAPPGLIQSIPQVMAA